MNQLQKQRVFQKVRDRETYRGDGNGEEEIDKKLDGEKGRMRKETDDYKRK